MLVCCSFRYLFDFSIVCACSTVVVSSICFVCSIVRCSFGSFVCASFVCSLFVNPMLLFIKSVFVRSKFCLFDVKCLLDTRCMLDKRFGRVDGRRARAQDRGGPREVAGGDDEERPGDGGRAGSANCAALDAHDVPRAGPREATRRPTTGGRASGREGGMRLVVLRARARACSSRR